MKKYNESDRKSIYNYAKKLKYLTFNDVLDLRLDYENKVSEERSIYDDEDYIDKYRNKHRKGGLGDFIEKVYFDIDNNSESRPDFYKAKLELKLTPFKKLKNGKLSSKERLVISMINYNNIVKDDFYSSNLWHKIEHILMIFYLWEKEKNKFDYTIYFIYMYNPSEEDLIIIKEDFYKIKNKVLEGKAHELSEGDTLYVGACTKSSDSSVRTSQPFNSIPAKPRAFSFKNSYMTYIIRNYVNIEDQKIDSIADNNKFENFENLVLKKLKKYYKKDVDSLMKKFNITSKSKQKLSMLVLRLLDVNTEKAEEFEKANIEIKTISRKEGCMPKESMSFPAYNIIEDIVKKDFYESDLYEYFYSKKFLFVEFIEKDKTLYLNKAKFWNMPYEDINVQVKKEWEEVKRIYIDGVKFKKSESGRVYNSLPNSSKTEIIHSRPHTRNRAYYFKDTNETIGNIEKDADLLPNGDMMTKQCFWLNYSYIYKQIKDND